MREDANLYENYFLMKNQSGRGNQDDRAKNGSKISQRFDHKMGSRGPFGMLGI